MQFPETTIMLQDKAITGKIKYGTPHIRSIARYVDPPPKPTLEYSIAVTKNNIDKNIMVIYLILNYASQYCPFNSH